MNELPRAKPLKLPNLFRKFQNNTESGNKWSFATIETIVRTLLTLIVAAGAAAAQTGPAIGSRVPDFEAPDQNGTRQTLRSIMGSQGAMLVFFRSADW
jgi:hypothetical protein